MAYKVERDPGGEKSPTRSTSSANFTNKLGVIEWMDGQGERGPFFYYKTFSSRIFFIYLATHLLLSFQKLTMRPFG